MEDNKVLATVAGKEITEADLNREMQSMDEDKKQYMDNPFYREECLNLLIDMYVFEKYGEEIRADKEEEFVRVFENTKRDMLAKFVVSKKLKEVLVNHPQYEIFLNMQKVRVSAVQVKDRDMFVKHHFAFKLKYNIIGIVDKIGRVIVGSKLIAPWWEKRKFPLTYVGKV